MFSLSDAVFNAFQPLAQLEKLRQVHAKEKKEALEEFRAFKRSTKEREEAIQVRNVTAFFLSRTCAS